MFAAYFLLNDIFNKSHFCDFLCFLCGVFPSEKPNPAECFEIVKYQMSFLPHESVENNYRSFCWQRGKGQSVFFLIKSLVVALCVEQFIQICSEMTSRSGETNLMAPAQCETALQVSVQQKLQIFLVNQSSSAAEWGLFSPCFSIRSSRSKNLALLVALHHTELNMITFCKYPHILVTRGQTEMFCRFHSSWSLCPPLIKKNDSEEPCCGLMFK